MPTPFTPIILGETAAYKILENEEFLAFLNEKPIHPGHALVIPKKETDWIFDLGDEELSRLMGFAKKVARAIKKAMPCEKVGVMVAGLQVRHAHIHLVPIFEVSDMNFDKARSASPEDLKAVAEKIKSVL